MATNPYVEQSAVGYNPSGTKPPDDGTQSSQNQLEWQKHIDMIGDPIKDLADNVDDAVNTAFGALVMTTSPDESTVIIAMEVFN